jgi:4-carboxymuconolactone decarboxylase
LHRLIHSAAKDLVETGGPRTDLVEQLVNALGWPTVVELLGLVGFYCMVSFTRNAFDVSLPNAVSRMWSR